MLLYSQPVPRDQGTGHYCRMDGNSTARPSRSRRATFDRSSPNQSVLGQPISLLKQSVLAETILEQALYGVECGARVGTLRAYLEPRSDGGPEHHQVDHAAGVGRIVFADDRHLGLEAAGGFGQL